MKTEYWFDLYWLDLDVNVSSGKYRPFCFRYVDTQGEAEEKQEREYQDFLDSLR